MVGLPQTSLFVDVEHLLVTLAAADFPQARAVTDLPAKAETQGRIVQITRTGGGNLGTFDVATVLLDAVSSDLVDANAFAVTLADWLYRLPNRSDGVGRVYATEIVSGPSRRPDPNPNLRKVGVVARLTVRPA